MIGSADDLIVLELDPFKFLFPESRFFHYSLAFGFPSLYDFRVLQL
jgi:hypothetical protein